MDPSLWDVIVIGVLNTWWIGMLLFKRHHLNKPDKQEPLRRHGYKD